MTPREAVIAACTPRWRKIERVLEEAWRGGEWPMRSIRAGMWDAISREEIELNMATAKIRKMA